MKIGIVTEYYYPILGGISESVHNTKIWLENMGHEVKIITSHSGWLRNLVHKPHETTEPDVIRIGVSVPVFSNGSFAHLTAGANLRAKMRAIFKEEKFELLHLHSPIVPTLPPLALLEAKCPVVGTFHTYFDRSSLYAIFKRTIQRGLNRLNGQIAVSESCVKALRRYFNLRARIIPNGVDTMQFNPDVSALDNFRDDKMNLLFVSRFDPRNGLAFMFRTFELVKTEFPAVRLIIVGDGPLRPYYRRILPRWLESDVHFAGLVRDRRPLFYASCDVFCSPVTKASFGVTLLEAMASGKPIVATENRGYRDIMSQDEGFLVPPNNQDAFAKAILTLLRDGQLRKNMGLNGRMKALRYSWDSVVCDIADYYEEIVTR